MKIPYGNKVFDVNDTYVYKLGKVIGTNNNNNPVFIHEYFVHNNKETKMQKHKIAKIDKRKHIIYCENSRMFIYYDNCKYVRECTTNSLGNLRIF